ncbi:MAG: prepilin-type N-terminal cleavage/methylation domain-containing protein [Candidatus Sumerlaeia bacterium]
MLRSHSHPRQGMSLVEVLVALVLLTVGLGGVVEMFIHQANYVDRNGRVMRAETLAYNYLNQLQAAGYGAIQEKLDMLAKNDDPEGVWLLNSASSADNPDSRYTRSLLDRDFRWNALLIKEKRYGLDAIQIRVVVLWGPEGISNIPKDRRIRKEVMGYVIAP